MRLREREGGASAVGLLEPVGAAEESPIIYARFCDTTCQKPWTASPIGTCSGLCKVEGDAFGNHPEKSHVCNTCGYTWT